MAPWLTEGDERRIAVVGNAGGGKSTLARRIAVSQGIPYVEVDRLLWQKNWEPADPACYALAHDQAIDAPSWVIDGLGRRESIPKRLARSTGIILVDLPLWIHFWLAAERQIAWSQGHIKHAPAGAATAPPTEALFRTIWEVDQTWMSDLRQQIAQVETEVGKTVLRISTLDQLNALTNGFPLPNG